MKLRLLQPLRHPSKRFPARLELGPGLRVPQQVRQGALGPAQDALRKDGLRDRVPLEFGRDALRQVLGVDLLGLSAAGIVVVASGARLQVLLSLLSLNLGASEADLVSEVVGMVELDGR